MCGSPFCTYTRGYIRRRQVVGKQRAHLKRRPVPTAKEENDAADRWRESARCGGEEDGLGKKKGETTLFTPPVPPVKENTLPRLSLPGCSLSPVSRMTVVSSAFMQWSTSKKITKSIVGMITTFRLEMRHTSTF